MSDHEDENQAVASVQFATAARSAEMDLVQNNSSNYFYWLCKPSLLICNNKNLLQSFEAIG